MSDLEASVVFDLSVQRMDEWTFADIRSADATSGRPDIVQPILHFRQLNSVWLLLT